MSPCASSTKNVETDDDRRIAAMLLRDARSQGELAEEHGSSAYLSDGKRAPRVNERLLKGEISQARSHNKRCGVDMAALPKLSADEVFESEAHRQASALEQEFIRRAHSIREGAPPQNSYASAIPGGHDDPCGALKKRQRVKAPGGRHMDVAMAEMQEAEQADEDIELSNPLLRPPSSSTSSASSGACKLKQQKPPMPQTEAAAWGQAVRNVDGLVDCTDADEPASWVSKKLRVRIVDESGQFKKHHLKKGVVNRVDSLRQTIDIKLDDLEGDGRRNAILRDVAQSCLETVVSKGCARVEIVRGSHRGLTAELLERNTRLGIAVVRLSRGFGEAQLQLPLDSVCEF
eukprot:CAMPEP_0169335890 /NCGR_PEP_ID=MMETSP1017-20121227/16580_1 /TAXON_ID=342587 /ORGANISM="Karlodinium micrum, Strain CCMP2283" /LENGTH=345 /DNA_ID=CAMNT_0009431301 /DNA_START=14 /DNA_END=1048 /DNA_ORIENTATION=-